ncbi:MAG TPA: UDP-N-acetylglucosamine 4,6-dehydratase (inverting) [Thermohalobaculum sp.]|nr:UDP-N-acetylglucosamine 4,6-dehydratase (inverting) [Thermohalobaculum sp.]
MTHSNQLDGKSVLVTGGTGSFGKAMVERLLCDHRVERLVVFSRDELKQFEMAQQFSAEQYPQIRYFLGDVRDRDRLMRAFSGVDVVIHAAAMKHITAAEYNPTECIATNVLGAQNVVEAAIQNDVEKVIALSTDKAANPINLYGATKLCSDKLFITANNLAGRHRTRCAVVRYGNVIGSRGSVIPYFKSLAAKGKTTLPVTDPQMTRFAITLTQGIDFVLQSLEEMLGGELFVPKLPSIRVTDLVPLIVPEGGYEVVGIRPGEKLHEVMIPQEESRNCVDMGEYYVLQPAHHWWNVSDFLERVRMKGKRIEEAFEYSSHDNTAWIAGDELKALVDQVAPGG